MNEPKDAGDEESLDKKEKSLYRKRTDAPEDIPFRWNEQWRTKEAGPRQPASRSAPREIVRPGGRGRV